MGLGVARKIKIVLLGEQQGVDGVEENATEVKNVYAEINTISQVRAFDANTIIYKNTYEFILRYDSSFQLTGPVQVDYYMIEYNNRRYSIQSVDRVNKVRARDKYANQLVSAENGRYWRVLATSDDIS